MGDMAEHADPPLFAETDAGNSSGAAASTACGKVVRGVEHTHLRLCRRCRHAAPPKNAARQTRAICSSVKTRQRARSDLFGTGLPSCFLVITRLTVYYVPENLHPLVIWATKM